MLSVIMLDVVMLDVAASLGYFFESLRLLKIATNQPTGKTRDLRSI
jgi:hypothetical protein